MTDSDYEFWMHLELAAAALKAIRSYSGKSLEAMDKERIDDELERVVESIAKAQVMLI